MKDLFLIFISILYLNYITIAQENRDQKPLKLSLHASYGIFSPVLGARTDGWPGGFGSTLRFRMVNDHIFKVQIGAIYHQFEYISPQGYSSDITLGNLRGEIFSPYLISNGHPDGIWFPSFRSIMLGADLSAVVSLRNAMYKYYQRETSWDISIDFGFGFMQKSVNFDLFDIENRTYSNLRQITGSSSGVSFDTADGRKFIRKSISETYDNKYETESSLGKLNYLTITYGLTISKLFANKYEIGFNYKTTRFNNSNRIKGIEDQTVNHLVTTDEKFVLLSVMVGYYWEQGVREKLAN